MRIRKSQVKLRCMWCHLVAKSLTNASGATWWPNFLLMYVPPSGGWISKKCMWRHLNLLAIGYLQLRCQPMGPLCLWQCFVDTTFISNIISLSRLFLTRAVSSMCQSFLGWTLVNSSKSTSMSWTWPTLGEEIMFRTDLLDDPSILDEYSMASASVYIQ